MVATRCGEIRAGNKNRLTGCAGIFVRAFSVILTLAFATSAAFALGDRSYVRTAASPGAFPLVQKSLASPLYVDSQDYWGVLRAAGDLETDITRVTGCTPTLLQSDFKLPHQVVLIGTVGKSALLDRLASERRIDVSALRGKWESFLIQVVAKPFPGVESALVIAGSDKRGTIYGIYDISEQIGISPWYWWADVPVAHRNSLFVGPGRHFESAPAVRYRGIFLNDEAPSLSGWVHEKFGSYNHEFYTRVFELLLRLKANYLWPAMWGSAFNEDDPLNPKLADEYGIVMGTSHHEPMLRAQQEWKRDGTGPWDYAKNGDVLRRFWRAGIERNKNYENIITLGMRGDGDLPMSEDANVSLLERIVHDQRQIIADEVNPDLAAVPQSWALYKEVQTYYEKGMRVPDDVTLLWCDDNWGNIRRLPTPEERKRAGGAGIYYHFDYVGDPRNYKWLNTIPITKVWEQMHLAHEYDANRIWIVNVGDLKPMEFPIEFFLDLAREPQRWGKDNIQEFTRLWAAREFGPEYAPEIADVVAKYTKFNGRRKPELLEPDTFSLTNYREADLVLADFQAITAKAEQIYTRLPADKRAAFYELVLYPTKASEIVAELYVTVGRNHLYGSQGRAGTNSLADRARALFQADADLAAQYNHVLAGGKWDHMMDQTHIGYTGWQQPPVNVMPKVVKIQLPQDAEMGVAAEGSPEFSLPQFDRFGKQRFYVDIYNRGQKPFQFSAIPNHSWILLDRTSGTVQDEQRVWASIDWAHAPAGLTGGLVQISQKGGQVRELKVTAFNPPAIDPTFAGFVETDRYISMEAAHYSRKFNAPFAQWEEIRDYGRTLSSMTIFPVTALSVNPPAVSPRLEYDLYAFHPGAARVKAILAPTLNFVPGRGLRFGVSFDGEPVQVVDALAPNSTEDWTTAVKDSVRVATSVHSLPSAGAHTLKIWMVDPGLVPQKLIVDLGGLKPSYLGPPESIRIARLSNANGDKTSASLLK